MPDWWLLAAVVGVMAPVMAVLWEVQRRRQDASLVDAGWTVGIGLGGVLALVLGDGDPVRRGVVAVLVGAWSLRLGVHLVRDRLVGKPEDGRYRMLREKWGASAQPWFFAFFQAQALLVGFFVLPFVLIAAIPAPFGGWADVLGILVWLGAFIGETLADHQLARWRADPANLGRTCRGGLWRWSRHPNYFCEWLLWLAYVALAAGGAWWLLALTVPTVLLVLLTSVTGIPYTERRALVTRGDDYRAYQRATSPFIPWFPRREHP